jgi:hypothetical protein
MLGTQELLFFVVAIFVLWIVLKLAKIAIRVIFFILTIAILAGVLWYVFVR